ncbi:hypothetical protein [Kingella negevensis]|uniref:hypothetical protein n=2 Tax=Kingella negevensis TaxID=1522312 RepID=UPI00050A28C4|nr:hypothetical protein [Kingella negevensis]WII91781.1 hypothetical protein QEO93_04130 [Kingella negevensis]WII93193.1 hypothetical protein QEO94_11340 [Kingella negevensis]
MMILNGICGVIIFVFCACRLGGKEWQHASLEFWSYVFLLPCSVGIAMSETPPTLESLSFRVGVAAYFVARSWRIGRLKYVMFGK